MHTDRAPAFHFPFSIKNCRGETTFQNKFDNPTFKIKSQDHIILTTDMPHEALTTKIDPKEDALRATINIMIHWEYAEKETAA